MQREALLRDHANRIALSRARAFHPYWLEFLQKRARAQTGGRSAAGSVASVTLFGKSPGASTARAQTAGARSAGTSLDAKLTSGTRVSKAPAESSLADVTSSLADAARGGRVLEDPRVSARLSETPRTKVSFGDGPRPASGIDGGAEPARPRSALWRTENARARPPSRELRFEDAQGKRESIMEEADGEETASAPLAENRSADGSNLDRNDGQKSEGPGERQSDQAGLRKSSEGFAASFDGKSAGLRNGETRTPSRLKTEDGLAAEPVEEPGLVSGPDGGIQTLDALTPTSRRSSSWLPRNNSLRTSSVVSSRYIATLFDIGATESTDEPFEPLDWAESQSNGAEWAPPTHWSENRRSRPSSREASGGDAAGARPRSRGFGGSDRSDSPSRPGSRGRMAGGGVNADGGVNTGGGVSADGGVNAFGVANTESGKTAAAGSVNVLGDVNTPRSRQSGRKSSSGHNIVKAGANVEKENVDAGEGGRSASVNKHGRPSSREAEGVPAESLYPKDDYPSESEPLADSKVDPERAHREKLFKSKSRSKSRSRHDRGKRSGKSTGHSPQNYLPSTNRKFPWQLRWDALMRASVALEARAFPEGTCPLRILYESMRKEGEPRVALDGLKKGMRCGAAFLSVSPVGLFRSQCDKWVWLFAATHEMLLPHTGTWGMRSFPNAG